AAETDRVRGAEAAASAESIHPGRTGNHCPQGDGEEPAGSLRDGPGAGRRPGALPEGRADPGPAADPVAAGAQMDATTPGVGAVGSGVHLSVCGRGCPGDVRGAGGRSGTGPPGEAADR